MKEIIKNVVVPIAVIVVLILVAIGLIVGVYTARKTNSRTFNPFCETMPSYNYKIQRCIVQEAFITGHNRDGSIDLKIVAKDILWSKESRSFREYAASKRKKKPSAEYTWEWFSSFRRKGQSDFIRNYKKYANRWQGRASKEETTKDGYLKYFTTTVTDIRVNLPKWKNREIFHTSFNLSKMYKQSEGSWWGNIIYDRVNISDFKTKETLANK